MREDVQEMETEAPDLIHELQNTDKRRVLKRRYFNENCALLGYYAAIGGNSLLTFRDNLSARNYHYSLRNSPEERTSHLLRDRSLQSHMVI